MWVPFRPTSTSTATHAGAQGVFSSLPVCGDAEPFIMTVLDCNLDGFHDGERVARTRLTTAAVVVACDTLTAPRVFVNNGGELQPGVELVGGQNLLVLSADVFDLNKDAVPDILATVRVTTPRSGRNVLFLLGNGDCTFRVPGLWPVDGARAAGSVDLNKDRHPDVVVLSNAGLAILPSTVDLSLRTSAFP